MEKLEVFVTGTSLTLAHRGQTLVKLSIQSDHTVHALLTEASRDEVAWQLAPSLDQVPLEVEVITYEKNEESMALPRAHREPATNRVIKPPAKKRVQVTRVVGPDTIDEREAKQVLNEILRSMRKRPQQTPKERAAETKRIAEKVGVRPMAVAGVRANLTRGNYGPVKLLLNNG